MFVCKDVCCAQPVLLFVFGAQNKNQDATAGSNQSLNQQKHKHADAAKQRQLACLATIPKRFPRTCFFVAACLLDVVFVLPHFTIR